MDIIKVVSGDVSYDIDRSILMRSPYFKAFIDRWLDNTTQNITIPSDLTDGFLDYIKYLRNSNYLPKNTDQDCLDDFIECVKYFGNSPLKTYVKTYHQTICINRYTSRNYEISNQSIYLRNLTIEPDKFFGVRYIFIVDNEIIYEYNHTAKISSDQNVIICGIEMRDTSKRFILPQDILDRLNIRLKQQLKLFSIKLMYAQTIEHEKKSSEDHSFGIYASSRINVNSIGESSQNLHQIHLTYDTYEPCN